MATEQRQPSAVELAALRQEIREKAAWLKESVGDATPFSEANPPPSEEDASARRTLLSQLLTEIHAFSNDLRARAKLVGVGKNTLSELRRPLTPVIVLVESECGYLSRMLRKDGHVLTRTEQVLRVARRAQRAGITLSDAEREAIQIMSEKYGWKPV